MLGQEARDKITGFKGTVIGLVEHITSCTQVALQPRLKDGEYVGARYFDDSRCELISSGVSSLVREYPNEVQLGQEVKDQITGFKGIVTARTRYITAEPMILIQPHTKDNGDFIDSEWFVASRLEIISKDVIFKFNPTAAGRLPGGGPTGPIR